MKKVLFIDDEANSEKMKSRFEIIEENGIEIIPVWNIEEIIPTFKKHIDDIGLIIVDLIIPNEDIYSDSDTNGGTTTGFKIIEDIQRINPNIPIIVLSIRRKDSANKLLLKYKIQKYVEKPIDTASIIEIIKGIL